LTAAVGGLSAAEVYEVVHLLHGISIHRDV